jgi:ADP-ribosylglycohydrolase
MTTISDVFLGIAIGDAYGAGLEFQDRYWIRNNIDFSCFINKRTDINIPEKDLYKINYKEWDYTDDTEMTIAVTKAILSDKPFTNELLVNSFIKEYQLGYEEKGYYRNGHGAMRWVFNGEKEIEEIRLFQKDRKYPGNAPPMRAVPIGFLSEDKLREYATINATCTHPHPKAIDSSLLIAYATKFLLCDDISPDLLIKKCLAVVSDTETLYYLQKADTLPPPSLLKEEDYTILCGEQPLPPKSYASGINGLPSNAMFTAISALYILKHSSTAFDALKHSIYLGGDVDSLASICVGIASGLYGIKSIPDYMLDSVEGKNYIESVAIEFDHYLRKD